MGWGRCSILDVVSDFGQRQGRGVSGKGYSAGKECFSGGHLDTYVMSSHHNSPDHSVPGDTSPQRVGPTRDGAPQLGDESRVVGKAPLIGLREILGLRQCTHRGVIGSFRGGLSEILKARTILLLASTKPTAHS
jgi:hypothetical protein